MEEEQKVQEVAERYMREALKEAAKAAEAGEVPIGAVVVKGDEIVGRGHNRREGSRNARAHAERLAIDDACRRLGGWRLWECDLYVTLAPCPMCAGAIINSRIRTVYYGADDDKAGSCGSVVNLFDLPYNHRPQLVRGILADECSAALKDFFRELREKGGNGKNWKLNRANAKNEEREPKN